MFMLCNINLLRPSTGVLESMCCRDSASITAELTAAWLQLLQQQLQDNGVTLASNSSSSMRTAAGQQQQLDLQPFIR
jgi:hypothetical protein